MATRKEIRNALLERGVIRVQIVRTPDWRGGHYPSLKVTDLLIDDCVEYDELNPYEYIEFDGDATEVMRHLNDTFTEHIEPLYEENIDEVYTLAEMLEGLVESLKCA